MKFKKIMSISLATFMLVSSLSSSFIYADNKKEYTIALNEPYEVKQPKSAIALSVSTATALLTLATHAGITFHNSESMDEFLYRFVGLGNVGNLIEEVEKAVKNTATGTINLSRSLLEEIQKAFNKVTPNVNNQYKIIDGTRVLTVDTLHTKAQIKNIVESSQGLGVIVGGSFVEKPDTYFNTKTFTINGKKCQISTGVFYYEGTYKNNYYALRCDGKSFPSSAGSIEEIGGCAWSSGGGFYGYNIIPILYQGQLGIYMQEYYKATTPMSTGGAYKYCSKHKVNTDNSISKEINATVVGSGWTSGSGTINGNDGTTSSDLDISIPNNMGSLIDLPSGSVTTPNYETWKPGTSITVPEIANPGLEYTPEEVVPESPGDTDKPSTDVGSPDKPYWNILETIVDFLKKIWQSILDILEWLNSFFDRLAQTLLDILSSLLNPLGVVELIYEWLLNFFDTLLEFLTHILVPSENYFVDTFNDIKERLSQKLPNVDITKLEELGTGTKQFEDMYGTIFGQRVLLAKTSIIHKIISIAQPILQGIISLGLIVYNYNQIYFLIRGQKLSSARNVEGGKN